MTFLYANRLKLCMRIDFNVGDSNCKRNDFDVCESTKVVSAKRPRCMRIDLHANRLVCETTDIRPFLHDLRKIRMFSRSPSLANDVRVRLKQCFQIKISFEKKKKWDTLIQWGLEYYGNQYFCPTISALRVKSFCLRDQSSRQKRFSPIYLRLYT